MSYPSSHTYETIYIVKSSLTDTDVGAIHQKIENVITKFEGKVAHKDEWGLLQLSYPIEDHTHGRYTVLVYNGKGGVVEEIERHFKISEDVIRFLTVAVPADYDYLKGKKQMEMFEEEAKRNREFKEQKKRERM